jgi:hypothetical protein
MFSQRFSVSMWLLINVFDFYYSTFSEAPMIGFQYQQENESAEKTLLRADLKYD